MTFHPPPFSGAAIMPLASGMGAALFMDWAAAEAAMAAKISSRSASRFIGDLQGRLFDRRVRGGY
jgi:hypothetical protein